MFLSDKPKKLCSLFQGSQEEGLFKIDASLIQM